MIRLLVISLAILALENAALAATITIKPGETIEIRPGKESTIRCESEGSANEESTLCHKFHGDSACNGMPVGGKCAKGQKQKGTCVSTGFFAGAVNCECR